MMPPGWAILLLCLSASAENNVLCGEFGEAVTLKCSSEGCPHSVEKYTGMYLYLRFEETEEKVLYYYKEIMSVKCEKFQNRIQMKGSLRNNTITISNLTLEDAGSYQCVYTEISEQPVRCKVHTLVVRGPSDAASASGSPCSPTPYRPDLLLAEEGQPSICGGPVEKRPPLVLVIGVTCAISVLVTITSLLLILRVKHWREKRGTATATAPQVSRDNVYETMNKNGLHPLIDLQNPQMNQNDLN